MAGAQTPQHLLQQALDEAFIETLAQSSQEGGNIGNAVVLDQYN